MKVAMAQINTTVGDIRGNRDRVLQELEKAQKMGADLALFPELCLTGYPPRDLLGVLGQQQLLGGVAHQRLAVLGVEVRQLLAHHDQRQPQMPGAPG